MLAREGKGPEVKGATIYFPNSIKMLGKEEPVTTKDPSGLLLSPAILKWICRDVGYELLSF